MSLHADPGLFGRDAFVGFGRRSPGPALGPVDPPDPPEEHERTAPYCDGPGHLYGHAAPGYYSYAGLDNPWSGDGYVNPPDPLEGIIEPCPACPGQIRNHRSHRRES